MFGLSFTRLKFKSTTAMILTYVHVLSTNEAGNQLSLNPSFAEGSIRSPTQLITKDSESAISLSHTKHVRVKNVIQTHYKLNVSHTMLK